MNVLIRHQSEAAQAFKKWLADVRADGVPSEVVVFQSENGGNVCEGVFGALWSARNITQEFTTENLHFNGITKRALGAIESAALAARIQAYALFPNNVELLDGGYLWAESASWACGVLNRAATAANPVQSRHTSYGTVTVRPFLKPGYCKVEQSNKLQPEAQLCFYVAPQRNHPTDFMRVLTSSPTSKSSTRRQR